MTGQRKILMLHGFVQSDKIFNQKTGGLRKILKKIGYDLYYPCGTELVDTSLLTDGSKNTKDLAQEFNTVTSTDNKYYGWWMRNKGNKTDKTANKFDYTIPQKTYDYLHDYCQENGPFDGIIGFSQGAGLAGYLATDINKLLNLTLEEQPTLKFVILFSGFKLEPKEFQNQFKETNEWVPSLHIQGELDTVVPEERSMKIYDVWGEDKRTLLKHPGSHFIPNSKPFASQVASWIIQHTQNTSSDEAKKPAKVDDSSKKEENCQDKTENTLDDDLLEMMDSIGKL